MNQSYKFLKYDAASKVFLSIESFTALFSEGKEVSLEEAQVFFNEVELHQKHSPSNQAFYNILKYSSAAPENIRFSLYNLNELFKTSPIFGNSIPESKYSNQRAVKKTYHLDDLSKVDKSIVKGYAAQLVDYYERTGEALSFLADLTGDTEQFKTLTTEGHVSPIEAVEIDNLLVDVAKLVANTIHKVELKTYIGFMVPFMTPPPDFKYAEEEKLIKSVLEDASFDEEELKYLHREYISLIYSNVCNNFPASDSSEPFDEESFKARVKTLLEKEKLAKVMEKESVSVEEYAEEYVLPAVKRLSYLDTDNKSLNELEEISTQLLLISMIVS